eukprot:12361526-Alexandrium_andersonii.AAC.1
MSGGAQKQQEPAGALQRKLLPASSLSLPCGFLRFPALLTKGGGYRLPPNPPTSASGARTRGA